MTGGLTNDEFFRATQQRKLTFATQKRATAAEEVTADLADITITYKVDCISLDLLVRTSCFAQDIHLSASPQHSPS